MRPHSGRRRAPDGAGLRGSEWPPHEGEDEGGPQEEDEGEEVEEEVEHDKNAKEPDTKRTIPLLSNGNGHIRWKVVEGICVWWCGAFQCKRGENGVGSGAVSHAAQKNANFRPLCTGTLESQG